MGPPYTNTLLHRILCYVVNYLEFAFSALTLLFGCQEEHPGCKNSVIGCWCGYLSGKGADCLHMVHVIPLPSQNLIISCLVSIQIDFTFLVQAYPGCPGKEAVKWM